MNEITKQFLGEFPPAELSLRTCKVPEIANMSRYLKSRQDIKLSVFDMDELAKDPDSWFYDSDIEVYNELSTMSPIKSDIDFSKVDTGYGISDYVGGLERYLPNMAYLQYCKNNGCDITMTIYDAHSLYNIEHRNKVLRDKVQGINALRFDYELHDGMPLCEFESPAEVKYTIFKRKKYQKDVMAPFSLDPIPMLCVNIPYEYYIRQPIPINTYCWDINKEEHLFCNKSKEEFLKIFADVCENGITHPMFMRMNGEIISSNDDMTNVMFFIAKLLRLPSIPVILYLSDDDNAKNHLLNSTMRFTKSKRHLMRTTKSMKIVLEPEIIINKPDENIIFPNGYGPGNYITFKSTDFLCVRYLDDDAKSNFSYEDDTEEIHKKLQQEAENKLHQEVDEVIAILSPEDESEQEAKDGAGN